MKKLQLTIVFAMSISSSLSFSTYINGEPFNPTLREMLGTDSQVAEACEYADTYWSYKREVQDRTVPCARLRLRLQAAHLHYLAQQEMRVIDSSLTEAMPNVTKEMLKHRRLELVTNFPQYDQSYQDSLSDEDQKGLEKSYVTVLSWFPSQVIKSEGARIQKILDGNGYHNAQAARLSAILNESIKESLQQ